MDEFITLEPTDVFYEMMRVRKANKTKNNHKVHFSSDDETWCTPKSLFKTLHEEFDFELDAAASHRSAKCSRYYTIDDNALEQSWKVSSGRAVFCNPPYGRKIRSFVEKAYNESLSGTKIVLLIPARVDTTWFHQFIHNKDNIEVRFLKGRLKFETESGKVKSSAPFPSMIVVFN